MEESRVIGLIELSKWENAKGDPNMSILINIPSSHFASTSPASFLNVCVFFQTSECLWGGGGEAEVSAKPLFTSSTISPSPPLIYKQLTKNEANEETLIINTLLFSNALSLLLLYLKYFDLDLPPTTLITSFPSTPIPLSFHNLSPLLFSSSPSTSSTFQLSPSDCQF